MSDRVMGTCSICGGQVAVPGVWHSIFPPTPTCLKCGAQAANHGPIIEMRPAAPNRFHITKSTSL